MASSSESNFTIMQITRLLLPFQVHLNTYILNFTYQYINDMVAHYQYVSHDVNNM